MPDHCPAYEIQLDKLLRAYGLESHLHDSVQSKMAYLIIALDNEVTRLRFPGIKPTE